MSLKENNLEIIKTNKNNLVELEQFYCSSKIDDFINKINEKKEEVIKEIIEYQNSHMEIKYDKYDNPTSSYVKMNPLVIQNYFFKSINPIHSNIPDYNSEKLGIVYDYYSDLICQVNDKIGNFPPSLTSFCKFSGITTNTLRAYKNSSDINMRNVVEKIYDEIGDNNITMAQMGMLSEKTTIFKMKSQNEITEKVNPTVKININESVDLESVKERINNYKYLAGKK